MQYKLQIQTLKNGSLSLSMCEFLTKMKTFADVLAFVGYPITEEDQVLHIVYGLCHEYDPVVVPITSRTEPYTLNDVGALLLSFENRLEHSFGANYEIGNPLACLAVLGNNRRP